MSDREGRDRLGPAATRRPTIQINPSTNNRGCGAQQDVVDPVIHIGPGQFDPGLQRRSAGCRATKPRGLRVEIDMAARLVRDRNDLDQSLADMSAPDW